MTSQTMTSQLHDNTNNSRKKLNKQSTITGEDLINKVREIQSELVGFVGGDSRSVFPPKDGWEVEKCKEFRREKRLERATKYKIISLPQLKLNEVEMMKFIALKSKRFSSKYQIIEIIGEGGQATVYKAKCMESNELVAVKVINCFTSMTSNHGIPTEIYLHQKAAINNPGVIKLYEWMFIEGVYILILEFNESYKDCITLLEDECQIDEQIALAIFREMIITLKKCYGNSVLHRDIKPENVLIDLKSVKIKLIDFGCAVKIQTKRFKKLCGTEEFYPPEWHCNGSYDGKCLDMYLLGNLLYSLLQGEFPFDNNDQKKEMLTFRNDVQLSSDCRDLLRIMLCPDEDQRWNIEQIENHDWMGGNTQT